MEPIDLVQHGGVICNDGWIPYYYRMHKNVYNMPKDGDPYVYIKDYNPNNEEHRKIVERARRGK